MITTRRALALPIAVLAVAATAAVADPLPGEQQEHGVTSVRGAVRKVVVEVDGGAVTVRLGRAAKVDVVSKWVVKGDVRVSSGAGDVVVKDVKAARVTSRAGAGATSFERVRATQPLRSWANGGAIRLDAVTAPKADLSAGAGSVTVGHSRLPVVEVSSNGGAVSVTSSWSRTTEIEAGAGSVRVDVVTVPDLLRVSTNGGDITAAVPAARYAVTASSNVQGR